MTRTPSRPSATRSPAPRSAPPAASRADPADVYARFDGATIEAEPDGTTGRLRRGAPLPVAAVVATVWASLLSFAPVAALVALGTAGAPPIEALRLAGAGWLLGHGVPIQTAADTISLVPLALTLFVLWRLVRAGVHVSRAIGGHRERSVGLPLAAGVAVGVIYGLIGGIVATIASTPDVTISVSRAAFTLAVVGGVPACLGALGHSRAGRRLLRRAPAAALDGIRAGVLAVAFTLATGAAGAGVSLALHGGDAAAVLGGFRAGVIGQAGITLACLAYVPNAAIWGAAYLLGPGFALGVGTTVSTSVVLLGPVPALPLLPGVPSAPVTGVGPALLAAPLVAALVAGWLLGRRRGQGWGGLLSSVFVAAPVSGLLLIAAASASAGGLGSGRLAQIGPDALPVGIWGTAVAGGGLFIGAVAARLLSPSRRAE